MDLPKRQWGLGTWQDEPDQVTWVDDASGLTCHARRGPVGAWCGYVGVPKGHPAYELDYDGCTAKAAKAWRQKYRKLIMENAPEEVMGKLSPKPRAIRGIGKRLQNVSVHGGLTFAGKWDNVDKDLWFFGFDCAHAGDLCPQLEAIWEIFPTPETSFVRDNEKKYPKVYRTLEYVQDQCRGLARQLAALSTTLAVAS